MTALNIGLIYCWRLFTIVFIEHVPQKDFRIHVVSILIRRFTPSLEVRPHSVRSFRVADEI